MEMLQEPGDFKKESIRASLQSHTAPPQYAAGQAFVEWLREGVQNKRILINDRNAKIHTVSGMLFLVTPGIFQRYTTEHSENADGDVKTEGWRGIQRQFEKIGIHVKLPSGHNIWTCWVKGPRKTSLLNGYLIRDIKLICGVPPADNKFITLITPEYRKLQ